MFLPAIHIYAASQWKVIACLGELCIPLSYFWSQEIGSLIFSALNAKGKTDQDVAWSRTVRQPCGIISDRKTQALEITGSILHEARGQDHSPMGRMGFLLQAVSQLVTGLMGQGIDGSMGFLLQAIDTPNYFVSEKGQGLSLGSGKFSSPLRGQRAVGSVL